MEVILTGKVNSAVWGADGETSTLEKGMVLFEWEGRWYFKGQKSRNSLFKHKMLFVPRGKDPPEEVVDPYKGMPCLLEPPTEVKPQGEGGGGTLPPSDATATTDGTEGGGSSVAPEDSASMAEMDVEDASVTTAGVDEDSARPAVQQEHSSANKDAQKSDSAPLDETRGEVSEGTQVEDRANGNQQDTGGGEARAGKNEDASKDEEAGKDEDAGKDEEAKSQDQEPPPAPPQEEGEDGGGASSSNEQDVLPPMPPLADVGPPEVQVGSQMLPSRAFSVGFFTVVTPTAETKVAEIFQLRLHEPSQLSVHTVRVSGVGVNSYGQFRLEGVLNIGTFQLVCHKIYGSNKPKTPRKPKKEPVPKPAEPQPVQPAAPMERRLSQRARKPINVHADEEDYVFDSRGRPLTPRTPGGGMTKQGALVHAAKVPDLAQIRRAWDKWKAVAGVKGGEEGGKKRGKRGNNGGMSAPKPVKVPKGPTEAWVWSFVDEDGDVYEGEMKDGWRHGMGMCIYNGGTSTGVKASVSATSGGSGGNASGGVGGITGLTNLTGQGGFIYQGEWKQGKEHGKGKLMTIARDVIYEGEWVDGKMCGKGTYHFKSGGVYEGEWRENQRHGKGTYTLPDGSTYEGEWKDDLRWGHGAQTWPENKGTYDGEWVQGMMHGRGTLNWHDGFSYQGQFVENRMEGKGICDYANGQHYEGMWKNGKKDGRGTLRFPSGAMYEGRFRDDHIDGQGTLEITKPVPDVNEGDWMIPLDFQVDVARAHMRAGFDKEGL